MEIKYKKSLKDYKYLIMFDLASKITGVCIYDLIKEKPIKTQVITVKGKNTLPVVELFNSLDNFFTEITKKGILREDILVSFEAMPTQMHSAASTIQTFMALAKSHAILDLYLAQNNIDVYDHVGVYPISTHSYYKKMANVSKEQKVTKEDIRNYVIELYPELKDITLDESDAVFLAKTFIEVKWNKDLDEEIRAWKKHGKTLKINSAIKKNEEKINFLKKIKH